jgi:ketol-acid reductoisomerase
MAHYFDVSAIDPKLIKGRRVAMLGYGNQGRPQALNLRDSGCQVVVGLRRDSLRWATAESEGFSVSTVAEAVAGADFVMMNLPDTRMAPVYRTEVEPNLRPGAALAFCHGFNIRFGLIDPRPDLDVILISPKGAGVGVRSLFEQGSGVPGLVGVHQDATGQAEALALSYAWGIGCARAFILKTTFAAETETDLFGEQAVLCGGIPELIKAGFDTLVEAGYEPELAYFECLHETKLIIDLLVQRGFEGMRSAISDTAEWGGFQVGPRLITEAVRAEMRCVLEEIREGRFAEDWVAETDRGMARLKALRSDEANLPVEVAGAEIRRRLGSTAD